MNDIKNLNIQVDYHPIITLSELLNLKSEIEEQLELIEQDKIDTIKRKDNVKNKTKLSELTINDRIFGIGLSSKDLEVYFMDYCNVEGYNDKTNSDWNDINVSHKTKTFGVSTSIHKENADKHYFLVLDTMQSGYDCFFTLKPETWEKDLKEALEYKLKLIKKRFNSENNIIRKKVKAIIKDGNNINKYIYSNCI